MKTSNYTVNIIEPNEGFYLTHKDNPGDTLSNKVFLAATDSPDNWMEISIEEGDKLNAEIEQRRKEEAKMKEDNIEDAELLD